MSKRQAKRQTRDLSEAPTAEQLAAGIWDLIEINPVTRQRAWRRAVSDPLDAYAARRQIVPRELLAGERLRGLFYAAGLAPRLVLDLNRVIVSGGHAEGVARHLEALVQWRDGVAATGRHCAAIVVAVVCYDQPAGWAGRRLLGLGSLRAAQTVGLDRLRCGLSLLADHWRIGP